MCPAGWDGPLPTQGLGGARGRGAGRGPGSAEVPSGAPRPLSPGLRFPSLSPPAPPSLQPLRFVPRAEIARVVPELRAHPPSHGFRVAKPGFSHGAGPVFRPWPRPPHTSWGPVPGGSGLGLTGLEGGAGSCVGPGGGPAWHLEVLVALGLAGQFLLWFVGVALGWTPRGPGSLGAGQGGVCSALGPSPSGPSPLYASSFGKPSRIGLSHRSVLRLLGRLEGPLSSRAPELPAISQASLPSNLEKE